MSADIAALFSSFNAVLEAEAKRREDITTAVKEIGARSRAITAALQSAHKSEDVAALHANTAPLFAQLAPLWQLVRAAVGADPAEKHRHLWRFTIADLVASAVYREWLCTHRLLTLAEASEAIGYFEAGGIDVEDYLIGVTALPKELSRLCVNCVTRGNYELPQTISHFVSDLYSAFQILNLRNDALRKKYDAIKYDLTSIEQVVYDISVRRLAAGAAASNSAAAAGEMSDVAQQAAASAP